LKNSAWRKLLIYFRVIFLLALCNSVTGEVIKNTQERSDQQLYDYLVTHWGSIFPDGNRNGGGALFFKFLLEKNLPFGEFLRANKLYCAVSGSLVRPNAKPDFVALAETESTAQVCGDYFKCCSPCSCDLMKYTSTKKTYFSFADGEFPVDVIAIQNPCDKSDFPSEIRRSYFCNGSKINENRVYGIRNMVVVGVLHDAAVCTDSQLLSVQNDIVTGEYCRLRNNAPLSAVKQGMGDIFIKLAD